MKPKKAERDTTIADIHRVREEMAKRFDGDIAAMLEDARSRQEASGKPVWRSSPANTTPAPDKVAAVSSSTPAPADQRTP
ncbi:MAG: hypothetical protein HY289_16225 [Planctomycetes bacterium]|nr:hypothetical protein [Planctomycetota bacterium]